MNVIPANRIAFSKLSGKLAGCCLNPLQAAIFMLPVFWCREKQSNHADDKLAFIAARTAYFDVNNSFKFIPVAQPCQVVRAFKLREAPGGSLQPVADDGHHIMKKFMGNGGIKPLKALDDFPAY